MYKITHTDKNIDLSSIKEIRYIGRNNVSQLDVGNSPTWRNPLTGREEPIISVLGNTITPIDPRIKKSKFFYYPATNTPHIICHRCGETRTNVLINSSKDTMILVRCCCDEYIVYSKIVLEKILNKVSNAYYRMFGMFHKYIISESNSFGRSVPIRYNDLSLMLRNYIDGSGSMNYKKNRDMEFVTTLKMVASNSCINQVYLSGIAQRLSDYVFDGRARLNLVTDMQYKIKYSEYDNIYKSLQGITKFFSNLPKQEGIGLQFFWFGQNIL